MDRPRDEGREGRAREEPDHALESVFRHAGGGAGRPLWVTDSGEIREVYDGTPDAAHPQPPEACEHCGDGAFVLTVVREHRPCGYVAFDGFVNLDERRAFQCPKCDTVAADPDRFAIVSVIWTCCRCGRPSDATVEVDVEA